MIGGTGEADSETMEDGEQTGTDVTENDENDDMSGGSNSVVVIDDG